MALTAEAFLSNCILKAINDSTDYMLHNIKSVINNKRDQNFSTKIYCAIERTLNIVIDKKNKDTNFLYDIIERIFFQFRNNENIFESVKYGLQLINSDISNENCEYFINKLYEEVCQDEDLYKEIIIMLCERGIENSQEGFQQLYKKLSVLDIKINSINNECHVQTRKPVKSRTQEYSDIWNKNMFLNNFDKREENAGVNIKLKDVYWEEHLPHYIWGEGNKERHDLKQLLSEYVNENKTNKMLLILGQPGIGKSTLISWISANFINRFNDILIYRFATDLNNIDWIKIDNYSVNDLLVNILGTINFSYTDLEGKILILEGFDEISIGITREKILNFLYWKLIKENLISNFLIIVTCRENYIENLDGVKCEYITLLPWDEKQIKNFCRVYQNKSNKIITEYTLANIIKNKDILGIPIILYMVLALNISVEKECSIVDVYDKIFALDGGIYDRCIDNKEFASNHRIGKIKKQIHKISREIAIWMFENNASEATIPRKEYEKICNRVMTDQMEDIDYTNQDILIGNYFRLVKHCDGIDTEKLCFIHRSLYEYFVAETVYNSIENDIIELSEKSQETMAKNIAYYLKEGEISPTIGEYLGHKLIKQYNNFDIERKQDFYLWWENTVSKMIEAGMFYYTKRNIHDYKNIIKKEGRCFLNLLVILRYLLPLTNRNYILEKADSNKISDYIGLGQLGDYSKLFLGGADLRGKKLHELDLTMVCLRGADLRRADLVGANLYKVDLQEADLRGADIRSIRFKKTLLTGAMFDESQIIEIQNYNCNFQDVKIYIEKQKCFINYEEYCKRNNNKK